MDGCTLAAASLDSLPLADLLLAAWLEAPFREPPMLFVALWLWLDRAPDEGRAPGAVRAASAPLLGSEGGGRRSPRRRARRTQAARKERPPLQRLQAAPLGRKTQTTSVDVPPPFPRPGPSHTQSPSQGRRPAFATPPRRSGGPGACGGGVAGNSGTRQADWLKLRTVTLLLEHLNREPREGKGLGTWRRRSRRRCGKTSP